MIDPNERNPYRYHFNEEIFKKTKSGLTVENTNEQERGKQRQRLKRNIFPKN